MITYQDLQAVQGGESARADFVRRVIREHLSSDLYNTAKIADDYVRMRNTTVMNYQRMITLVTGERVQDPFNPVHRMTSGFFKIFVTQLSQYLLANGPTWKNPGEKKKLGEDFDTRLQELGKSAIKGSVSFGFFNLDHVEVFNVYDKNTGNFAPIYDDENGLLAAGVRFWQTDVDRPLRATLYELDGYTEYLWSGDFTPTEKWAAVGDNAYAQPKRSYIIHTPTSEAAGPEDGVGENYPFFPIVPMWANPERQSEILGLREKIDAYDMILNGFEDDLDNAQLYWVIKGAGGMDDPSLAQFLDRLRTLKAATTDGDQEINPVGVEIPYEARERLLDRLEKQLYKDSMLMNPTDLSSSAATATQIRAAYTPQNNKADELEYCVIDFIHRLLKVAGLKDETPTFTRSMIVNAQEEVQTVVSAATYLDREYVTTKILNLLGDGDKAEEVLRRMDEEDEERLGGENMPPKPQNGSPDALENGGVQE